MPRVPAAIFLRGPFMACPSPSLFLSSVFLKTLLIKWISQCDSSQGSLTHSLDIFSSHIESYTGSGRVSCAQVTKQFSSRSMLVWPHSLFLGSDPLGTCPTVSHVTHKDHGGARVTGSTACSYINHIPAVALWHIWPFLPLVYLHTSATLLAVDSFEYF